MEPRKSFLLRIDAALWKEIEAWSEQELRSVNGQIEYLLREAVKKRTGQLRSPPPPPGSPAAVPPPE